MAQTLGMPTPVRRLVLPAVALAAFAAAGCQSNKVMQPSQAQTAGMRIDVVKADYSQRKQRIDVRVRIWNDHDQRVHYDLGDVRLQFKGREVSPTPGMTKDQNPDVQAKSNRQFDWSFEVGDVRLQFKGREVSPTPGMTKDQNPDVQAKSNRQFDWSFEVGDVIGEGTYPIMIRNLQKGGAPLGETAEFKINLGA